MRSRTKIFYTTGLISLIMLPLLCLYHFNKQKIFDNLYCLEVTYPEKKSSNTDQALNLTFDPTKYDTENFNTIILTGNSTDRIKLDYARIAINELIHQPDTTQSFEFIFGNHAKYESLVRLFDICADEEVPNYLNYQDKFFVFNWRPKIIEDDHIKHWICGTSSLGNSLPHEVENTSWTSSVLEIFRQLKKFWISAVLFTVMIGLTVVSKTGPYARK